ncbi:AraC family transcriptional regulator [Pedobacter sp. UYP1]|uniref:helix-turn-helix domain-containing protein n=1 Tax=Pedobacter sp. UYP1 TaxID=1756396 RepID=UPI003396C056
MNRPEQIKENYLQLIDKHLDDLIHNRADYMFEIEDFAEQLHIHSTHLSNTIKALTGTTPCGLYQTKILSVAKLLLQRPGLTIRQVALMLDFEPSQFTKWFKRFHGISPKEYRSHSVNNKY